MPGKHENVSTCSTAHPNTRRNKWTAVNMTNYIYNFVSIIIAFHSSCTLLTLKSMHGLSALEDMDKHTILNQDKCL